MAFDYLGAVQAGYSPDEIATELKNRGVEMDISGALKSGYSDDEIASELNNRFKKESSVPSRPDGYIEVQEPKQEEPKQEQGILDSVGHFVQMPSKALQEVLSKNPADTGKDFVQGATQANLVNNAFYAGALEPAGNIATNIYNQATDSNAQNPITTYRKDQQNRAREIEQAQGANPSATYELGDMVGDYNNLAFGGAGATEKLASENLIKEYGKKAIEGGIIGSGFGAGKAVGMDEPLNAKDILQGGATLAILSPLIHGVTQSYSRGLKIADSMGLKGNDAIDFATRTAQDEAIAKSFNEQAKSITDTIDKKLVEMGEKPHFKEEVKPIEEPKVIEAPQELPQEVNEPLNIPNEAELNTLFETVTDTNGNIKTLKERNKSNGWQDTQNTDKYGQEYTTRMGGERGLDSELTTPKPVLKKLKEKGYEALSDSEKSLVNRDVDTIRNHPDFKVEEPISDNLHPDEHGQIVDENGNLMFSKDKNTAMNNFSKLKEKYDYTDKKQKELKEQANEELTTYTKKLEKKYGLKTLLASVNDKGIKLDVIRVDKENQKQGKGTSAMQDLIKYADDNNMPVYLTTAIKDDFAGTTSSNRLKKFYKQFDFVENKGRNSDYSISGNMYRLPKEKFYSKNEKQGYTTKAQAEELAKKTLGKQYDNLKEDINIVQKYEYLPQDLRDRGEQFSSGGKVRGIFDPQDGKVHLIADSMSAKEVPSVVVHELLHKSIANGSKPLGEAHDTFVLRLKQLKEEPLVKEAFQSARDAGTSAKHMDEEMMSYLVEKYQLGKDMSPRLKRFISDLIDKVKVFVSETAVKLGVDAKWLVSKMNEKDIASLLKASAIKDSLKSGTKNDVMFSKDKTERQKRLTEWHKDSAPETKNEDGTPKVFYHGTDKKFNTFDLDKSYDGAFWFTENKNKIKSGEVGASAKGEIMPVYLKAEKMAGWEEYDKYSIGELINKGYDGVKLDDDLIVFNPEQIKSIHNKGTFDSNNPNILFSKAKEVIKEIPSSNQPKPVQEAIKKALNKNIVENTLDKGIQKIVGGAIKLADAVTAHKISNTYDKLMDTQFMNNMFGHKIYKAMDYMDIRDTTLQNMNKAMTRAMDMHNMLKDLSSQAREAMYDYATGDKTIQLTPELKKATDTMIKMIDDAGQKMVDNGILSKEAYEEWQGQYLHRKYTSKMKNAKDLLYKSGGGFKTEEIKARGKIWEATPEELQALKDSGEIGKVSEGKIEVTELPNGKISLRRDWTKEERKNMGEIRDIAFAFPETYGRLAMLNEHGKLLSTVPEKYIAKEGKFTDAQLKDFGYTKLDGKKFGALNGRWVSNTIADDIHRTATELSGDESLKAYKEFVSMMKASHTIYNTSSHVNNLLSNITMQFTAGLNPVKAMTYAVSGVKSLKGATRLKELNAKKLNGLTAEEAKEYSKLKADKNVNMIIEAQELGLFGRSQLNSILRTYLSPTSDTSTSSKLGKIKEGFSKMYEGEDNIMRFSAYKQLIEKGFTPKEAVSKINNDIIPDYSKPMSKYARSLRDSGVVPFMSWIYYSTPMIVRQLKEHPSRTLALLGGIYAIDNAFGVNPYDEKDMPQDGFGKDNIVTGRNGNKVDVARISSILPQANLLSPIGTVKGMATGGIPQTVTSALFNMDLYNMRPVTQASGGKAVYQYGKNLIQNATPTPDVLDRAYNLTESHILPPKARKSNNVMEPRTPAQEAMSFFVNTKTYDKSKQREKAINDKLKEKK